MDKYIKESYGKAFSDSDIKTLCDNKVKIVMYSKFKSIKDIRQVLEPFGACIILYETKQGYGHWCALLLQKSSVKGRVADIEHFDSYGMRPDDELSYVPENLRQSLGEDYPHLTYLLAKATGPKGVFGRVVYNSYPLQKSKKDTSTCGRWCGLRVVFKRLNIDQFIKMFKGQKFEPDWYATALTAFV